MFNENNTPSAAKTKSPDARHGSTCAKRNRYQETFTPSLRLTWDDLATVAKLADLRIVPTTKDRAVCPSCASNGARLILKKGRFFLFCDNVGCAHKVAQVNAFLHVIGRVIGSENFRQHLWDSNGAH